MRAPDFWWHSERTASAMALTPAGWLMGRIAARRMAQTGADAGVAVICVGNFVAGGAGKTPTALACAKLLQASGYRPAFLSRGYGGSAARSGPPLRVDPMRHDAALTGDEPLLLAQCAPTIVSADRRAGAAAAISAGADVIVMDDGLQNPALLKDFSIAVVDGETGVGNGLCIPAGPLRAPFEFQLGYVDALLRIGDGQAGERVAGRAQARGIATFHGDLRTPTGATHNFAGQRVVAFAGIGRPGKFFASLEAVGAQVVDAYSFDDHQMLNASDLADLRAKAHAQRARLATTEKDAARLRGTHDIADVLILPVELTIAAAPAFAALMLDAIKRKRAAGRNRP